MHYFLGLGSNLGDREQTISQALHLLDEQVGKCLGVAPRMYSAPQGFISGHEFCNTVALYDSSLTPMQVLAYAQVIERRLGRTEHSFILPDGTKQYADREIDIDIIQAFYDNGKEYTCNTPDLTLPHPRMNEREFVLKPMSYLRTHLSTTASANLG